MSGLEDQQIAAHAFAKAKNLIEYKNPSVLEKIDSESMRLEERLNQLKSLREILEKNKDLSNALEIIRNVGIF